MPKNKENFTESTVTTKPAPVKVVATKTIRNVALQAWSIPAGKDSIRLGPGRSVVVPVTAISERVLNLQKRRLITIS